MTLAEWMIPELTLSGEVQLEAHKRTVRAYVDTNPREVAELACTLMTQLTLQESITRKATHRIAELELRELLSGTSTEAPELVYVLPGEVGWFKRTVLRLVGLRSCPAVVKRT